MVKLINTDGFKAIKFSTEISQIARPLSRFGITYFNHKRIYQDGSHLSLATDAAWLEHFFKNAYYNIGNFSSKYSTLDSGILLWNALPPDGVIKVAREDFNIDNGITIIDREQKYIDFYLFASNKDNYAINNFYLNNIDILKHFINFYKEQTVSLIKTCIPDKPESPLPLAHNYKNSNYPFLPKQLVTEFYNETKIKRYLISYNDLQTDLPAKQYQLLTLLLKGLSIKETARLLNITPKTCQIYIDNIKARFNCLTKQQLLKFFRDKI